MLDELRNDKDLYDLYIRGFIARLTCSSISVEANSNNAYIYDEANPVFAHMRCFDYLNDPENVRDFRDTLYRMNDIVNIMTNGEYDGYRRVEAIVNGSNVSRSKPNMIRNDMYYLYNNYENLWCDLDPFLREAYFHISFLHIHPFGDGNGRISRLLMACNFLNSNIAPPVIPPYRKREYCDYIENKDYVGLANMLHELSLKEENVINGILVRSNNKKRL